MVVDVVGYSKVTFLKIFTMILNNTFLEKECSLRVMLMISSAELCCQLERTCLCPKNDDFIKISSSLLQEMKKNMNQSKYQSIERNIFKITFFHISLLTNF